MRSDAEPDYLAGIEGAVEVRTREAIRREKMAAWLEVYAVAGWREACAETGCADGDILRWRRLHPEFKEAMEARNDAVALALEEIADGIARGEVQATTPQVQMLQFRLKGLRPEVYRERTSVDLSARAAGPSGDGDAARARLLLAEWTTTAPGSRHPTLPDGDDGDGDGVTAAHPGHPPTPPNANALAGEV